jgi:hypothetical protein
LLERAVTHHRSFGIKPAPIIILGILNSDPASETQSALDFHGILVIIWVWWLRSCHYYVPLDLTP